MNQGLQRMHHGFYRGVRYAVPDEDKYQTPTCGNTGEVCGEGLESYGVQVNVWWQTGIIVIITMVAMMSVATGLERGIVNLSRFTFALGCFLVLVVLFMGETYMILDSLVQTWGYYLFSLLKVGFFCDAWERLGSKDLGLGGAPDDLGGGSSWISDWTMFLGLVDLMGPICGRLPGKNFPWSHLAPVCSWNTDYPSRLQLRMDGYLRNGGHSNAAFG